MWFFPLKFKSDVFPIFKRLAMAERQFKTKFKTVQTYWGGEFRNLSHFLSSLGILHRLSCAHTSEQHGFVEQRHQDVVETRLTLLAQSSVPQRFWHFAFETTVYLINRTPSQTTKNTSPFEYLFHHKPDFSFLRVFGCQCYPHLHPYNQHKMDFRSTPCVFLGYNPSHHGYRCLDPSSDRIYIVRHVRFNDTSFLFFTSSTHHSQPNYQQPSPDPYISFYPNPTAPPVPVKHPSPAPFPLLPLLTNPPLLHTYKRHTFPPPKNPTTTTQTPPEPTISPNQPSSPSQPAPDHPPETGSQQPSVSSPPNPPLTSTLPHSRPSNLRPNLKETNSYKPSSFHTTPDSSQTKPPTFTTANTHP
ncbi:hypothetical protein LXL04_002865 [Taraxacum kok-saghyz]